jgi:predicted DNA-binding protein YlxM (UPF0122 family)
MLRFRRKLCLKTRLNCNILHVFLAADKQKRAVETFKRKNRTVQQICEMMNIIKPSLYAYIKKEQASQNAKA